MTYIEVKKSKRLNFIFSHIFNLHIEIFEYPYFQEQLKVRAIANHDILELYDSYCADMSEYDDVEEAERCLRLCMSVLKIIIKVNPDYHKFRKDMLHKEGEDFFPCSVVTGYISQRCSKEYDNHTFITIRIKEGSFTVVKHHLPELIKEKTWGEFVDSFSSEAEKNNTKIFDCIKHSHYLMDEIFGGLNAIHPITIAGFYMCKKLASYLKDNLGIEIFSLNHKEIVIEVPDGGLGFSLNTLRSAVVDCFDGNEDLFDVQMFDFHKPGSTSARIKHYYNDVITLDFPTDSEYLFYNQILKYYMGLKIEDSDLLFDYNGRIAKYLKPIDNPFRVNEIIG